MNLVGLLKQPTHGICGCPSNSSPPSIKRKEHGKKKILHGQSVVVPTWSKEIQISMKAQRPIHMEKLQGTHHTLYKDVHHNQEMVEDLGYLSIKAQLRNLAHLRSK